MSVLSPRTSTDRPADGTVGLGQTPPASQPGGLPRPETVLGRPMPTDRLRGWLVTLVLGAIAAVVRLQNLGFPTDGGTPVFDEKYYVAQAWQTLRNGGFEDNPGYELVVHPPLGKHLIAIGEWLFGYNGFGWRFTAALCGVAMVILVVRIARRLTRSTLLGGIGGVLLICDGLSHVESRIGMLDIFQALFVVAAFACLLVDRDEIRRRMARVLDEGRIAASAWGPRLGFRWWRFAGGVCVGLALAVKWNGLYYVAAFGLLTVFFDVAARRAAGVRRPWVGTLVRDVGPALWTMVAVPVLLYLASWWAWFAGVTGTDRHAADQWHTTLEFLPKALQSLVYYQANVLDFHEHLVTPPGHPHPWESKPWTWPMGLRPMLYYYESGAAVPGCGQRGECVSAVMLIGTPAMWWLALPVAAWSLWRILVTRDWRYTAVVVAYGAGFFPWFVNLDRQMYYFYATALAPFLVLGLVLVLGEIMGRAEAGYERRTTGVMVVALYVGLVVANFAWLWPILNADPITPGHWQAEMWLPSWR